MIFTVGHSAHPATRFAELLRDAGVALLIDVRRYPGSRRHPQFRRDELERWLPPKGTAYRFEGDRLGGQRGEAPSRRHPALDPGLAGYAEHMRSAVFRSALEDLEAWSHERTIALMCAEAAPQRCHRWLLSDALALLHGLAPTHLGPDGTTAIHVPSPTARIADDDHLVYDLGADRPLF